MSASFIQRLGREFKLGAVSYSAPEVVSSGYCVPPLNVSSTAVRSRV